MKHLFGRRQRIGLMVALLALVFTVVTAQGGGLANTPWPMYQHDPGHSGRSDFTGINTPALMWKRELSYQWGGSGSGMSIGPDGTVYTVTEGNLFALTYPDAQVKWMIDKAYSYSVPAVSASNLLYWGFDDTFAVISSTGQITGGLSGLTGAYGFGSSPVIAPDGTVYVAKGALWSWTASGEINWYHNFGGMVGEYTSPALGPDGTIYMTAFASGGELFAFDSDGNVKWSEYFSANSSPT
ncbi:MAG: PQQ-like beta-propeller repeat protein, partial [Herpetosiphonaceae bacterium]|nr:PQQ-like beta-propeller repeat protein [Herpetosiphonaceae bacterium]